MFATKPAQREGEAQEPTCGRHRRDRRVAASVCRAEGYGGLFGVFALACLSALLAPGCGDDDISGNNNQNGNGDGVCGDGVLDPEEQCDQGAANSDAAPDACRTDCREASCGDAVVDTGESCDDGNASGDDGCSAGCAVEEGWDCSGGSCEPVCGDDLAVGPETCDGTDLKGETCVSIGQAAGALGCDAQCEWDISGCTGATECGDGVREGDEQCDDGNLISCDGCSDACLVEACGNGRVECDETCDDGDGDNTDGCPDGVGGTCQSAVCGDGFVWAGQEACDDGNGVDTDGCPDGAEGTCQVATCGDGILWAGQEACDDGNEDNTDGCPDGVGGTCQPAVCGDGFVWTGQEECDDGNDGDNTNACLDGCVAASCGDGYVWAGQEECDDGNDGDNTDACLDGCVAASCGDGYVWAGQEECDDGNGDNTDACLVGCVAASCGDGYVWSGQETCDGTNLGGESCTSLTSAYSGGSLGCGGACGFDVSGCALEPGLTWVSIPGGTYQMGYASGLPREQPVHPVNVPPFEMTATEVTVAQYEACVLDGGACTAPATDAECNWGASGYEDHPVNCVTWTQAVEFCTWAGGRLPSEAEWEYAARSAGPSSSYTHPWGHATPTCRYAVMYEGGSGCGAGRTGAVCSKPAGNTVQGLCDMAGNVWEWVEDDYHYDYNGAPLDGSAWVDSPRDWSRTGRGGGYMDYAERLRASYRTDYLVIHEDNDLGFRCAR